MHNITFRKTKYFSIINYPCTQNLRRCSFSDLGITRLWV